LERVLPCCGAPVVRVGWADGSDWQILSALVSPDGTMFALRAPSRQLEGKYRVRLLGAHQAINASLALAVGAWLGLQRTELASGLMSCSPAPHRLQLMDLGGVRVLDDTYNANADSMRVALETVRQLPCAGRRMAVLGDMAEQGEQSPALHAEVGQCAAEAGVEHLFAVGQMARVYGQAARAVRDLVVHELPDPAAAARAVCGSVSRGDLVLVKASRAMRLELVVEAMTGCCKAWGGGAGGPGSGAEHRPEPGGAEGALAASGVGGGGRRLG